MGVRIVGHTMRPVVVEDEQGNKQHTEVVHTVDFIDNNNSLHGLTFEPAGTDVSGSAELHPRIVGEHTYEDGSEMVEHNFATPEEAVEAYESGRL